jgi:hypothetical protein
LKRKTEKAYLVTKVEKTDGETAEDDGEMKP